MKLIEAIEEIQEKAQSTLTMESIIRKINFVRDSFIRNYENRITIQSMDLLEGVPIYPLDIPMDRIDTVLVKGEKYPYGQFNDMTKDRSYYYIIDGAIGIFPSPKETVEKGITMFYRKHLSKLNSDNLEEEIGLDEDYDMLVVYGVLKDITNGNQHYEYKSRYEDIKKDFLSAISNSEPQTHQIVLGGW